MYASFLVPVDLAHGESGARMVRLARGLGGPDATIVALHVLDAVPSFVRAQIPNETLDQHRAEAKRRVETLVHAADPRAVVIIGEGAAATVILEVSETMKPDAIILASHKPGLRTLLIGSTAARVVRHAACSVIVDRG